MAGLITVGGIVPAMSAKQLEQHEKEKDGAFEVPEPVLTGLAAYVKSCWSAAYYARLVTVDMRLTQATRQRNGEYDPQTLSQIKQFGGSEIYMMLTSNKCRAASAWLRDIYLANGDKPWTLQPTKIPDLDEKDFQEVLARATQDTLVLEAMAGQPLPPTPQNYRMMLEHARDAIKQERYEEAKRKTHNMADKMEDQLQQGGFYEAFNAFLDDLVTYPYAVLKGPIVRRRKHMEWNQKKKSGYQLVIKDVLRYEWERVDPAMVYWAPDSAKVDDGYFIERHHLSRSDLLAMKGTPGYDDDAIDEVLLDYGRGGLRTWLMTDALKADSEQKSILGILSSPEQPIDALQFWGNVQGQMLVDWGMDTSKIDDLTKDYPAEVWLIGSQIIKAIVNPDPLGRKPYYKASYEQIPGGWAGNGVPDLIRDCQDMCNAAARSLANNMAIASGPMVWVNMDRMARGEEVTQLYPWRIFQTTDSQMGTNTAPPIDFFQPNMFVADLMAIYKTYADLADEYSNIPKYMTGNPGGVGRTASGMSMLLNNATKAVKQVVYNIDINVMQPAIERLYFFNMRYSDDDTLKGDVDVVVRGVNNIAVKEQQQVQRNQFLSTVASSPILAQQLTPEAMQNLLREVAKSLDMDIDELIPPEDMVEQKILSNVRRQQSQQALAQAMKAAGPMPPQPMPGQVAPPGAPPPAVPPAPMGQGQPPMPPGPPGVPAPMGAHPMPPGQPGPQPPMPAAGAVPMPVHPQLQQILQRARGLSVVVAPDLADVAVQAAGAQIFGPRMRQNQQVLMDGRPITDAFAPQRR